MLFGTIHQDQTDPPEAPQGAPPDLAALFAVAPGDTDGDTGGDERAYPALRAHVADEPARMAREAKRLEALRQKAAQLRSGLLSAGARGAPAAPLALPPPPDDPEAWLAETEDEVAQAGAWLVRLGRLKALEATPAPLTVLGATWPAPRQALEALNAAREAARGALGEEAPPAEIDQHLASLEAALTALNKRRAAILSTLNAERRASLPRLQEVSAMGPTGFQELEAWREEVRGLLEQLPPALLAWDALALQHLGERLDRIRVRGAALREALAKTRQQLRGQHAELTRRRALLVVQRESFIRANHLLTRLIAALQLGLPAGLLVGALLGASGLALGALNHPEVATQLGMIGLASGMVAGMLAGSVTAARDGHRAELDLSAIDGALKQTLASREQHRQQLERVEAALRAAGV